MAVGAAEIQDAAAKNQSPSHRRAVRESGSVEENVNAAGIATAEESVSAAENATAAGNVSRSDSRFEPRFEPRPFSDTGCGCNDK